MLVIGKTLLANAIAGVSQLSNEKPYLRACTYFLNIYCTGIAITHAKSDGDRICVRNFWWLVNIK